jgi:ribosomal silencing factor RsfS
MAKAERMYSYLIVMSGRGENDAKALLDAIQISMTANDAEERAMQSELPQFALTCAASRPQFPSNVSRRRK